MQDFCPPFPSTVLLLSLFETELLRSETKITSQLAFSLHCQQCTPRHFRWFWRTLLGSNQKPVETFCLQRTSKDVAHARDSKIKKKKKAFLFETGLHSNNVMASPHTKLMLSSHPFPINVHKTCPMEATQHFYPIALSSTMIVTHNTSGSTCFNQSPLHPTRKFTKRKCWLF